MANDMMEAYLYEMNTLLESLDEMVLGAEDRKTFSQEDVNEIFRIMHTIKGSSAMMEFDNLMTVAHRIEDMFFIIRDKGMEAVAEDLRPELFDLIFQAIDYFKAEVEKLENGESLTDDIDNIMANINSFSNKIQGKQEEEEPAEAAAQPGAQEAEGPESHGSSQFPFGIQVFFDEGAGMENLRAFMLASAVKDTMDSENDFDYYPADVDSNAETAAIVVDEGFSLRFLTDELRQKALAVVKDAGSIGNYNLFEYEEPEAPEAPAPKPAEPAPQQAAAREDDILREIRQVNDEIPDEVMSAKIDRIEEITGKILAYQKAHPNKESQLRTFLNYYLPTTLKILRAYAQLDAQGIEGENISAAKKRIEDMMDQVVSGFEKQLDKLFQDDAMDITSDVEVLENMLKKDGLSDEGGITMTL